MTQVWQGHVRLPERQALLELNPGDSANLPVLWSTPDRVRRPSLSMAPMSSNPHSTEYGHLQPQIHALGVRVGSAGSSGD